MEPKRFDWNLFDGIRLASMEIYTIGDLNAFDLDRIRLDRIERKSRNVYSVCVSFKWCVLRMQSFTNPMCLAQVNNYKAQCVRLLIQCLL